MRSSAILPPVPRVRARPRRGRILIASGLIALGVLGVVALLAPKVLVAVVVLYVTIAAIWVVQWFWTHTL